MSQRTHSDERAVGGPAYLAAVPHPLPTSRPPLDARLSGAELRRWYWLLSELRQLARDLGVPAGGAKLDLVDRLAAALDGETLPRPAGRSRASSAPVLPEPLGPGTVLPAGQRCTEQLRAYFVAEIGRSFRFDAAMRDFVAGGAGRTLGEAVGHWHATRATAAEATPISAQFELNRFLRAHRRAHPGDDRAAALEAWREHRQQPAERRVAELAALAAAAGDAGQARGG